MSKMGCNWIRAEVERLETAYEANKTVLEVEFQKKLTDIQSRCRHRHKSFSIGPYGVCLDCKAEVIRKEFRKAAKEIEKRSWELAIKSMEQHA